MNFSATSQEIVIKVVSLEEPKKKIELYTVVSDCTEYEQCAGVRQAVLCNTG